MEQKSEKTTGKDPYEVSIAITDATRSLINFPNCKKVKPLKNHIYGFRLRVGRYRVFFDYDGEIKIIAIQEVKKRDERTY